MGDAYDDMEINRPRTQVERLEERLSICETKVELAKAETMRAITERNLYMTVLTRLASSEDLLVDNDATMKEEESQARLQFARDALAKGPV